MPLLALAGAALLAGMWAGLLRLGWRWPALQPLLPLGHGPLMVSGFFGTLILLERAVAIGQRWAYLGCFFSGIGGLLVVLGIGGPAGALLIVLGAAWMNLIFIYILRRHAALHTWIMAAGALCWLVGALFWLGGAAVFQVVFWWVGFLVFTIAGERLELSRVLRPTPRTQALFVLAVVVLAAGLLLFSVAPDAGVRLSGAGLLAIAAWLLVFDIARRTVRRQGLTRYIAVCLLAGYAWLAGAGVAALVFGSQLAGPRYDLMLHAVFLGFVMSMVFGHAPIIFPAILGRQLSFQPHFYAPLGLLHASLMLRLLGDLAGLSWARLAGGLFNALAILMFAALVLRASWLSRPDRTTA